eukprot:15472489-Alexandrium_andersonii.AAC.1
MLVMGFGSVVFDSVARFGSIDIPLHRGSPGAPPPRTPPRSASGRARRPVSSADPASARTMA